MNESNVFRIIIIDDNESIHHDFIKILKTESFDKLANLSNELFGATDHNPLNLPKFEIDVAFQGQEGVEKIKQALSQGIHYALAFVDIRMPPGWDGVETIKHIWEIDKDIQVVICTAYSDYSWEETVEHLGKTDNLLILKKPFDNVSVRQLACALTTKWQLRENSRNYTTLLEEQVADKTMSLQQSLSLVKSTFESSNDGIFVVSVDGTVIDYNQKFISMFQIPKAISEEKNQKPFLSFMKGLIQNHEEFFAKIYELHGSDETSIDTINLTNGKIYECYSQPHKLNNKVIGRILDFRDITKRAYLEQELRYQAMHDSLTGLGNRLQLVSQLKSAIKTANETQRGFCVLFIDLDRFKLINDSLSHLAGDELLKQAANRLKTVIRAEDILVRLGGDEFVIVFMNIGKQKNIEAKALSVIELFKTPFTIEERQVTLTASIGISSYPKDGTTVDNLLRNADTAMYRAKESKGNTYEFYSSDMVIKNLSILDQESELRQALINNEFFLCYQPQFSLANERLISVEALIRWNHPQKGIILPIDFIPLAEEIGLIVPIGEWVLRTACAQNKKWQDMGFPPIRVAVNISAQQLKQQNIVTLIKEILEETKLDPKYLEIELTENVILNSREIIITITELKKLGVSIAIDDFGTCYSILSYLHELPLDRLKIDKSFVSHIRSATDDEVIIRAVISMAKKLNLEVLAEGVETADQANFLKNNECGDVQGFFFSKPLPTHQIEPYLAQFKLKYEQELNQIDEPIKEK